MYYKYVTKCVMSDITMQHFFPRPKANFYDMNIFTYMYRQDKYFCSIYNYVQGSEVYSWLSRSIVNLA